MAASRLSVAVCNKCGNPATVKCKLCESTSYCSVNHQKLDWESHKKECEPFVILSDPLTGRTRWVATRKLYPGMLLLEEEPLLSYPYLFGKCVTVEENCIVCGNNFNGPSMKLCDSCYWNICDSKCENTPEHKTSECRVFQEYQILCPSEEGNSALAASLIAVLRGLSLKTTNPESYNSLLSLPTETFYAPFEYQLKLDYENMLKFLKNYMHPLEVEEYLYERVFRAVEINRLQYSSLEIVSQEDTGSLMSGQGEASLYTNSYVYDRTSYLSHSCVPNCSWTIGPFPDRRIRIRVATEIAKGQELTIIKGYDPIYREWGTRARHFQFLRKRGIICKCARCKDPLELGSYASAVTCFGCREDVAKAALLEENKGYLIPVNPLDFSSEALYQCNNCDRRILASQVNLLESRLQKHSEVMCSHVGDRDKPYISVDRSVKMIRNKLIELHPTHWIATNSIRSVVAGVFPFEFLIHRIHTAMKSKNELQNYLLHLQWVLVQESKLSPGLNPFTAYLEALLGTKLADMLLTFSGQLTNSENLRYFRAHKRYCKDALKFFEGDFPFTGQVANIITDHLQKTMAAAERVLPSALEIYR